MRAGPTFDETRGGAAPGGCARQDDSFVIGRNAAPHANRICMSGAASLDSLAPGLADSRRSARRWNMGSKAGWRRLERLVRLHSGRIAGS
jgi:hypothetical protein